MSTEEDILALYRLEIAVDHSQFFLEDGERDWGEVDLDLLYDEGAFARHLGFAPGVLSVFTAKWYGAVGLEILLRCARPDDDFTGWDHVAEASLDLASGYLVAYGPESNSDAAPRVSAPPGMYRVRVYSGGLETVDEYMQAGQDHYRVALWVAPYEAPALLYAGVSHQW
jgi:hypothetical protein